MPTWISRQVRIRLTWPRALIALSLPLIAVALRWSLTEYLAQTTYGLQYPAAFLAAWVGGPWIGLAATAIGASLTVWFIVEPRLTWTVPVGDVLPLLVFVMTGVAFAWFQLSYRAALSRQRLLDAKNEQDVRWKFAVEAGELGLWQWDMAARTVILSPRYQRILGVVAAEELVAPASVFFDNVHPDDVARVHEALNLHLSGRNPQYRCEFRLRHFYGHYVWTEARAQVVNRSADGRPLEMLGSIVDTTQRHQQAAEIARANESLRLANELQSLAMTAGGLGAFAFTLPNRTVTATEQCRRLYGFAANEDIGIEEVQRAMHPEDRPRIEAAIAGAIATRGIVDQSYRVVWPDGSIHWIEWSGRAVYENDQPTRFVGVIRAARNSDSHLLAEGIQQMVWIAEGAGVTYFNQHWLDFCGATLESHLGYGWFDAVHPDDRATLREVVTAAADDSVTRIEQQYRLRRHDGTYRWCLGRGTKLRTSQDAKPVWYGASIDVHDLHEALERARSADKAKAAFLATTSHELRTPLNSIIGFTSLLLGGEMGPLLEAQRKPLEVVQRSSQQLLRLVQDVLDFTAIEAGHLNMDIAPTPLNGLLGEVRDQLTLQAAARGIQLPDIECDEGLAALADAGRLGQVVRNLVVNGVTYTDRGSVRISAAREGRFARIDVTDSGIGIPAAEMHKVFQPFQPIQRNDGSIREGTGLGLAITRRLVESMGGEVGCSSEPGVGSRFWIKVPLAA